MLGRGRKVGSTEGGARELGYAPPQNKMFPLKLRVLVNFDGFLLIRVTICILVPTPNSGGLCPTVSRDLRSRRIIRRQ